MLNEIIEFTINESIIYCFDASGFAIDKAKESLTSEEVFYSESYTNIKKQNEFIYSRYLMHKVLDTTNSLISNKNGVINWPDGVIGSLSHKDNWSIFCFESEKKYWGIGIDIERSLNVKQAIAHKICNQDELQYLDYELGICSAFCAKEALFKAHYPSGKTMFYFHDATIINTDLNKQMHLLKLSKATSSKTPINHNSKAYWKNFSDNFVIALVKESN